MLETILQGVALLVGGLFIFIVMVPAMRKALDKLPAAIVFTNDDPTRLCQCYVEQGCSHVDGMHCEMKSCSILKDYRNNE